MMDEYVKDNYQRPIVSLRITITNRCNENCLYCHHDGMVTSKDEMTPDELFKICKIAKNIGVKKIRLSGGDPLVRKDIVEIVEKIASLDFKDISLTTNGVLLEKYAQDLKNAGLDRVNVSLDTLNRDTYKYVTSMDYLNEAKAGILKAVEVGLYPVKINMVIMKDINHHEVKNMFEFCKENGIFGIDFDGNRTRNYDMIEKIHEAGLVSGAWTIDIREVAKILSDKGVEYITTNTIYREK